MSTSFKISLEDLTPKQKAIQLKILSRRQHNGECVCYLDGTSQPPEKCKKPKKLSKSWVKSRESTGPLPCNCCPEEET